MTTPETPLPYNAVHHPQCGGWWTGTSRAHCPACCRTFSCDSAADKHRQGRHGIDRHYVDPATVGLVSVDRTYGQLWQNPGGDQWFKNASEEADGGPTVAEATANDRRWDLEKAGE